MGRIEFEEIPEEGLSEKEIAALRMERIHNVVNDVGGELRNQDKMAHPFTNYCICNREVTLGDGRLRKCWALFSSRHSAQEHQLAHEMHKVGGMYKALDKGDKPLF